MKAVANRPPPVTDADYERLVDRIRTHSGDAPGSDTERVTIRTLDAVDVASMIELRDALSDEDAAPGAAEFVLSPDTAGRVLEGAPADDVEALAGRLGRPVRVEDGMPDDAILLLDPDAVEGDELRSPSAIACGTLRRARG